MTPRTSELEAMAAALDEGEDLPPELALWAEQRIG